MKTIVNRVGFGKCSQCGVLDNQCACRLKIVNEYIKNWEKEFNEKFPDGVYSIEAHQDQGGDYSLTKEVKQFINQTLSDIIKEMIGERKQICDVSTEKGALRNQGHQEKRQELIDIAKKHTENPETEFKL